MAGLLRSTRQSPISLSTVSFSPLAKGPSLVRITQFVFTYSSQSASPYAQCAEVAILLRDGRAISLLPASCQVISLI